jgi:hypothetical protein
VWGWLSVWVGSWVGEAWSSCCLRLAVCSQAAEVAAICSSPACCVVSEANPVACLVTGVWGPLLQGVVNQGGAVHSLTNLAQQGGGSCWPRGLLRTAQEVARGPQACACRFQRMLVMSCFAACLCAAPIACCAACTTAVQYAAVSCRVGLPPVQQGRWVLAVLRSQPRRVAVYVFQACGCLYLSYCLLI